MFYRKVDKFVETQLYTVFEQVYLAMRDNLRSGARLLLLSKNIRQLLKDMIKNCQRLRRRCRDRICDVGVTVL